MDLTSFTPTLREFSPTMNDGNVGPLPTLTARFSTEIDSALLSRDINKYLLLVNEGTDQAMPVVYGGYENLSLHFTPASGLTAGATYLVTVYGTVPSPQGRSSNLNRSWAFKISSAGLITPQLLDPGNQTAVPPGPRLSWSAAPPPASGTIAYNLQIDKAAEFSSDTLLYNISVSGTSAIPASLPPGNTYFWRVGAQFTPPSGPSVQGPYSDPFMFYVGTGLRPNVDSQVTYSPVASFSLLGNSLTGLSNQGAWPGPFSFTFSSPVASGSLGGITFRRAPVDGYGNPYLAKPVLFTASLDDSGTVLTLLPGEIIQVNTRYTVLLSGLVSSLGLPLVAQTLSFTSRYTPLYLGVEVLRANFGHLLLDYPDDFLLFHIYRASLDVNRRASLFYAPTFYGGPSEESVRGFQVTLTWDMEKWTECETQINILKEVLRDLIKSGGNKERLADFEVEGSAQVIGYVREEINSLKAEQTEWAASFDRKRAHQRSGRKSEFYSRYRDRMDSSRFGEGRKTF